MAHFAEIDETNIVVRVLVVPDEQEHRGQEFLANDLGLGGRWIQTSYNNRIRRQYAGVGFSYHETHDVFVEPAPYPSWHLTSDLYWEPPIPKPSDDAVWQEDVQAWLVVRSEGNMSNTTVAILGD